jgi:hypothetical protein
MEIISIILLAVSISAFAELNTHPRVATIDGDNCSTVDVPITFLTVQQL